jgi:hypothetical protein
MDCPPSVADNGDGTLTADPFPPGIFSFPFRNVDDHVRGHLRE